MQDLSHRCPSPAALKQLANADLCEIETESLCRHVESCADCWANYSATVSSLPAVEVPGYLIVAEIGRGVASVVYAAWRVSPTPALVALKVLWPADEDQRVRFEREAFIQQRLDSPGIVKCYKSGSHGPFFFYDMELVRGEPLDKYLSHHAPTTREKLIVIDRVCRALAFAHQHGVAHRDLKPSNILVDAAGNPHILDFGLGTVLSDDWSSRMQRTQTRLGDVLGTIKYMSPEQAWGGLISGPIDQRSDVWSLGVLLYEAVTDGGYPFSTGPTQDRFEEEALLHRIRTELPKPPRISDREFAKGLKAILGRCLIWDKKFRFPSAAELSQEIQRCLAGRPRGAPWGYKLRRVATDLAVRRRSVLWLSVIVTTLLALTTLLVAANVRWREAQFSTLSDSLAGHRNAESALTPSDLVIVTISDDTKKHVVAHAEAENLSHVTEDIRSWRELHGRIMRRMAEFRPRAVVWDFYFRRPSHGDEEFVDAVRELHRRGVPVVLAVHQWQAGNAAPDLSPTIMDPLRDIVHVGAILARDMIERPGEFILVLRRDKTTIPSVPLSLAAALIQPDQKLAIEWRPRMPTLTLFYHDRVRADAMLAHRDQVALSKTFVVQTAEKGLRPGDELGCDTFTLHPPEVWRNRSVPYERLLGASREELTDWVGGKVVLFGDLRTPTLTYDDWHPVRYESGLVQKVPGCFLLADAITGITGQTHLRGAFPMNGVTLLVGAALALIGCLIPSIEPVAVRLNDRFSRTVIASLMATLGVVSVGLMLTTETKTWVLAGICGLCLTATFLVSAQIETTRRRFRIAPALRREGERLQLPGR